MSLSDYLNPSIINSFIQLISTHTGWHIRWQDQENITRKILLRMKVLKISVPETYYQLLDNDTPESRQEWQELAILLTTTESYLFRDKGQFSLLEKILLPEIIERQKSSKKLRIWSAGCSSGEEVYSLAILVKKLIPDIDKWNIFILGTDINSEMLDRAKRGIYNSWSFRLVDSEIQKQYFHPFKGEWQLDETIREMVKFSQGNLTKDEYPRLNSDICDMDLIVCRNVFLYFDSKSITSIVQKIYRTLNPGGYFMTGHAEIQGLDIGDFQAKIFPDSVVYQKPFFDLIKDNSSKKQVFPVEQAKVFEASRQIKTPTKTTNFALQPTAAINNKLTNKFKQPDTQEDTPEKLLSAAEHLFKNKHYTEAIKKIEKMLRLYPKNFSAYNLMAQLYANVGDYEQATYYSNQALKINSLSAEPYYLLAHIAEEKGKIEEAKNLYKKIIYLSPASIYAYIELAFLYEKEGDKNRAKKMRVVALKILEDFSPSSTVKIHGELTAGELIVKVKKMLNENK